MKRTFNVKPIMSASNIDNYGGYAIGMEDDGDQNYYVQIGNRCLYSQTEEGIHAVIDQVAEGVPLEQLAQQYVKSTSSIGEGLSRVVQISIDVEIPEGVDSQEVINILQGCSTADSNFNILGIDVIDDMTEVYENQYPDLLQYR